MQKIEKDDSWILFDSSHSVKGFMPSGYHSQKSLQSLALKFLSGTAPFMPLPQMVVDLTEFH